MPKSYLPPAKKDSLQAKFGSLSFASMTFKISRQEYVRANIAGDTQSFE
jgi:hypothetical protein